MNITREISITVRSDSDEDFALRFITRPGAYTINIIAIRTGRRHGHRLTSEFDVITTEAPIYKCETLERIAVEWIENDKIAYLF
jgi:hypothetical protein